MAEFLSPELAESLGYGDGSDDVLITGSKKSKVKDPNRVKVTQDMVVEAKKLSKAQRKRKEQIQVRTSIIQCLVVLSGLILMDCRVYCSYEKKRRTNAQVILRCSSRMKYLLLIRSCCCQLVVLGNPSRTSSC